MPRIFDKTKLKADCANCDAMCCVAVKLPYAHYPKPARMPCRHLDQGECRCTVFSELEERGYDICRGFDCYGAGVAVATLFRKLGKSWINDPETATVQFHTFSIVYFTLVKFLYPNRAIELDVPEKIIEDLTPFTEAALELLAEVADPFVVVNETKPL
jgi:hypothetical protein